MSVIIRLQNLPLTASSLDIRNFFHGLSIPDGGVHIVGGPEGDAFIAFSTDEDARQAMRLTGSPLKDSRVSLLLSSRNEMYKVIEQARVSAMGNQQPNSVSSMSPSSNISNSASSPSLSNHHGHGHHGHNQSHLASHSHGSSSNNHGHMHGHSHHAHQNPNSIGPNSLSSSASGTPSDFLRGLAGNSSGPADLSSNPALLFSTMTTIPSATLGGANANAFLAQGQSFPGIPSTQQSQTSGLQFGSSGTNAPPPASAFANGNPFLIPPPSLSGMPFPFPGVIPNSTSGNNPLAGAGSGTGMGLTPTSAAVMGMSPNVMNTTMTITGQGQTSAHHMNPFANPPPRMNLMSNGGTGQTGPSNNGSSLPAGMGGSGGPPRTGNSFPPGILNSFVAAGGMGGGMGGGMNRDMSSNRQSQGLLGPRAPFSGYANNANKDRFQFGAGPAGRMDMMSNRDNSRERRSRSRSPPVRDRRDANIANNSRRRRSRSRDRDRSTVAAVLDRDRRRRRSRSLSNSRSGSRDRAGNKPPTRRESRDKRDERRRSDSSPEKSSQERSDSERRSRREHEPSPAPNSTNTTTDEWPGAKLTGIPNDASYREIKEFIREEVMGGSDGVVRLYDEGIAYLKLENASAFPRVYRSNGRKLRGSPVSIEGITMEIWTQEYKLNKSRIERDIDRDREERERERGGDRDRPPRDHDRDRSDRHSSHSSHQRSSRFSNASQSSCIAIRGLAPTVTTHDVISRYLQEIPCEDVVLIAAPTPTNRHSVTAYVQFESPQTAQSVIDSIARSPIGATLVVETCDVDDLQKAKARTSGAVPTSSSRDRDNRGSSSGVMQDAKSIFELDLGLDDETTTVIMKGAPPNISERDVFDFFSDIGLSPMNVRIMYDSDGQCSGQVICEFQDNNKAKRATTKDGMLFGRGQISVSLLPSRNKRTSNVDFAQQQQQPQQQQTPFIRTQRPGLLGPAPRAGGISGMSGNPRFPNPNSPNIFEQALQQQAAPVRPPMSGIGRGRGATAHGERISRFNNARSDFRSNGMARGRGGGHHGKKDDNMSMTDDDMAIFNKTGCVVGLENIPYKASMDDILQYLEDILKIRIEPNKIIRRYDEMQKPTGDARVAFHTEFEAKLACDRLNGTYMWKRPISANILE